MAKLTDEELLNELIEYVRDHRFYFPRQAIRHFSTSKTQYRDRIDQFKQCQHPLMEELLAECRLNIMADCLSTQKDSADPRMFDKAHAMLHSDLLEGGDFDINKVKLIIED